MHFQSIHDILNWQDTGTFVTFVTITKHMSTKTKMSIVMLHNICSILAILMPVIFVLSFLSNNLCKSALRTEQQFGK